MSERPEATDLVRSEPDKYPPKFDPEIVKAIHWCRIGRVRPDDPSAFHRAKELGLLAQDSTWRATPQGEGVLIALGLLRGAPAPRRTYRHVLWAYSERYPEPTFIASWGEHEVDSGYDPKGVRREWIADHDTHGGPWRFFESDLWIDLPSPPVSGDA